MSWKHFKQLEKNKQFESGNFPNEVAGVIRRSNHVMTPLQMVAVIPR
jgi:hypothetical protein